MSYRNLNVVLSNASFVLLSFLSIAAYAAEAPPPSQDRDDQIASELREAHDSLRIRLDAIESANLTLQDTIVNSEELVRISAGEYLDDLLTSRLAARSETLSLLAFLSAWILAGVAAFGFLAYKLVSSRLEAEMGDNSRMFELVGLLNLSIAEYDMFCEEELEKHSKIGAIVSAIAHTKNALVKSRLFKTARTTSELNVLFAANPKPIRSSQLRALSATNLAYYYCELTKHLEDEPAIRKYLLAAKSALDQESGFIADVWKYRLVKNVAGGYVNWFRVEESKLYSLFTYYEFERVHAAHGSAELEEYSELSRDIHLQACRLLDGSIDTTLPAEWVRNRKKVWGDITEKLVKSQGSSS